MSWRPVKAPSGLAAFEAAARRAGRSLLGTRRRGAVIRVGSRLLPAALVAVLCAWWALAIQAALRTGDHRVTLGRLTVELPAAGRPVTIGQAELAQIYGADSAERSHIRLVRTEAGGVTIANAITHRRLEVGRAGETTRDADRLVLATGSAVEVAIGSRTVRFSDLAIDPAGRGRLTLATVQGEVSTRYEVAAEGRRITAARTGSGPPVAIAECPAETFVAWREWIEGTWREAIERIVGGPAGDIVAVVVSTGAESCRAGRTVYLPFGHGGQAGRRGATASAEINLVWNAKDGSFALKLGRDAEFQRGAIRVTQTDPDGRTVGREPLRGIAWPVAACSEPQAQAGPDGVGNFVVGRGRYAICARPDGSGVEIRPELKATLYRAAACDPALDGAETGFGRDHACPTATPDGKPVQRTFTRPANIFDAPPIPPASGRIAAFKWSVESAVRLGAFALCLFVAACLAARVVAFARSGETVRGDWEMVAPVLLLASTALAALPEIAGALGTSPAARTAWLVTILNWGFVGCVMAWIPRSGRLLALIWAMMAGLAAIGTITLTTLAAELGTTDAIDFIGKHKIVFIDLLAPLAMIVAVIPERWSRAAIGTFLLGSRLTGGRRTVIATLVPGFVHLGVIGVLLYWLVAGTQQGLGLLQPIEFGKFWTVVLIAVVLAAFERRARRIAMLGGRVIPVVSFGLLVAFVGLLAGAPIWRRDFSPLIIVAATAGLVLACRLCDIPRWVRFESRLIQAVSSVPHRFPPRRTHRLPLVRVPGPRWRPMRSVFSGPVSIQSIVILWFILVLVMRGSSGLAYYVLHIQSGTLPADRECRIETLVEARGNGRNTPAERFLAWDDLDYAMLDRPASTSCAPDGVPPDGDRPPALAIRFAELSFHVARSRSEVAAAPCRASPVMTGDSARFGLFDPARAVFAVGSATAWLLGIGLRDDDPLCKPLDDPMRLATGAERANLLTIRGPATIPVARNDFAGAYLLARHGIESGLLLLAFQAGLMALCLFVYVRLQWPAPVDRREAVIGYFLALVVLGSAGLFSVQWILAWSNVLGLLPVMGQPMTWLSYATSHHLLMALPAVLALLQAARLSSGGRPPLRPRVPPRRRRGRA